VLKKLATICSIVFAFWLLFAYLLIDYLTVQRRLKKADAVVVLAGSADYQSRTRAAAELVRNGFADRVLVTNDGQRGSWDTVEQRNLYFAELAIRSLLEEKVAPAAIEVLPGFVTSTREEGEAVVSVAAQRGYGSLILVTSGYHTRRTLWTFARSAEKRGLQVDLGIESPEADRELSAKLFWWLLPDRWRNVAEELPKLIYYRQVY
jgi:uncharacterized SAM-binding protein YcdF (DUF218 family)